MSEEDSTNMILCQHYVRKCQMKCKNQWFNCRLCHDEKIYQHKLDRFATNEIKCNNCDHLQMASNQCDNCQIIFAQYYCDICHLWTDDEIYHCNDCGLCRKGPFGDFQHCQVCGTCMKIEHSCQSDLLSGNCSICLDTLFDSVKGIIVLQCNHPIHHECLMTYLNNDYRCPICHRSAIDVSTYWKTIETYLQAEILPAPYDRWKTEVFCLDCQSVNIVAFHYRYHQCTNCSGFNTQKNRVIPFVEEIDSSMLTNQNFVDDEK